MSKKLLEFRQYVIEDDYKNRKNTQSMSVYKDELYNEDTWKIYNYHDNQDDICSLVNTLNNKVKEYDFFVHWLEECGLIDEHVLKTFQKILNTTNPIINMIEESSPRYASSQDAIDIYDTLRDAGFLGD